MKLALSNISIISKKNVTSVVLLGQKKRKVSVMSRPPSKPLQKMK